MEPKTPPQLNKSLVANSLEEKSFLEEITLVKSESKMDVDEMKPGEFKYFRFGPINEF